MCSAAAHVRFGPIADILLLECQLRTTQNRRKKLLRWSMPKKMFKDLQPGDRVLVETNVTGTIVSCARFPVVESAPGHGGADEVRWRNDAGEIGSMIVTGLRWIEYLLPEENA